MIPSSQVQSLHGPLTPELDSVILLGPFPFRLFQGSVTKTGIPLLMPTLIFLSEGLPDNLLLSLFLQGEWNCLL